MNAFHSLYWEMFNSHHVNFQIAMLSGADVAVFRAFEAKIQLLPQNVLLL